MLIFKKENFKKGRVMVLDRSPEKIKKKKRGKNWKEGDKLEEYECYEGKLRYLGPGDQDKPLSFSDEDYVLKRHSKWFKKA